MVYVNKVSASQALQSTNEMTVLEFVVCAPQPDVCVFLSQWKQQPVMWRKSLLDTVMGGLLTRCHWKDYSFLSPEEWGNLFSDAFVRFRYQHSGRFLDQLKHVPVSAIVAMFQHPHKQCMIGDTIACLVLLERLDVAEDFLKHYQGQYHKELVNKMYWPYRENVLSFVCAHQQELGYSSLDWAKVVLLKMVDGFYMQQQKGVDEWCWILWSQCHETDQEEAVVQWLMDEQKNALPRQVVETLSLTQLQGLTKHGDHWTRQDKHFFLRQRMESCLTKHALKEVCLIAMDHKDHQEDKRM